ncbi:MAG: monothiol glutaredoxin, Grx4 family [Rickettsiales bacterium]|nr:monothiol glutaredoxin, Grx4 family [Rickettsiales bacterium]|tara:strand:- start:1398 stop:2324 length:927 start_codon:yes stop_codon:yes gene_type:complete
MAIDADLQQELDRLTSDNPVVLFMKGNRRFPQCGFSARVVGILDDVLDDYVTVDVISRPDVRAGIKEYSDWPTLPQLYINGEFVGGCDIITEMAGNGELHQTLGIEVPEVSEPTVTVTPAAAEAFREAAPELGEQVIRLKVSRSFQYQMDIGPRSSGDFLVESNGVSLAVDRFSAPRLDGLVIDYQTEGPRSGFKMNNPNEPVQVEQISPAQLKSWLDAGREAFVFDVRTEEERATAKIEASVHLDADGEAKLRGLPKDSVIVFQCHHGARSQAAAEQAIAAGYTKVYNLSGGIDAWSQQVDPTVPRY